MSSPPADGARDFRQQEDRRGELRTRSQLLVAPGPAGGVMHILDEEERDQHAGVDDTHNVRRTSVIASVALMSAFQAPLILAANASSAARSASSPGRSAGRRLGDEDEARFRHLTKRAGVGRDIQH